MKKLFSFFTICVCLLVAVPAFTYDAELAQRLEEFYQPFEGKGTAKQLHTVPAPQLLEAIRAGEKLFALDVRTKGERGIYGIALPDSLAVEMSQVFTAETLKQVPTDRKVIVVCKSGSRATAIAMGLRQIGFDNVYVLKKGLVELVKHATIKNVY